MDLQVSLCKQRLVSPEDDLSGVAEDPAFLARVYAAYQQALHQTGGWISRT